MLLAGAGGFLDAYTFVGREDSIFWDDARPLKPAGITT